MPILLVYGIANEHGYVSDLLKKLQEAVAKISELKLTPDHVTVIFPQATNTFANNDVIVLVEGLFDEPERTHEVRLRLAMVIAETIGEWLEQQTLGTRVGQFVEVFVKRFNTNVDGFCRRNLKAPIEYGS